MTRKILIYCTLFTALSAVVLVAQIVTSINGLGGAKPALALPDFRAAGAAAPLMATFNSTLFSDLDKSGCFDMRAKSLYPLNNPQSAQDLRPEDNRQGYAL